ncbi:MAG TPA: uroporphyrinogen decarboxylase [Nitrospirota bacterium]|nr:uroporphyrinogen decarboxylase [Nitrospirota bacterium]
MSYYRFLKACNNMPVDRTPVWLMRQAGRYMEQYRAVRAKVSFLDLCKSPELCTEVTLQPIDILGVDAAILFSDILVPIEPMGMKLDFTPSPVFERPIRTQEDVDRLRVIDPEADVPFVMETIKMLRRELEGRVPLIGFSGAPFTLASYMVEGGGSKQFLKLKSMMYNEPGIYRGLMEKITETVIRYLNAQVDAGAQALQVFDTWGGILSPGDYLNYVLPYTRRVIESVKKPYLGPFEHTSKVSEPVPEMRLPVINFVGNSQGFMPLVARGGGDVIGVDWRIDIAEARRQVGPNKAVQGNLDPIALMAPIPEIDKRVKEIIAAAGDTGHIFNLGHGIVPETPVDHVKALVDSVHRHGESHRVR